MASIFLDTNVFFDIIIRDRKKASLFEGNMLYISPLSYHIYCYSEGIKIPDKYLGLTIKNFEFVALSKDLLKKAMEGPTQDLEDNIQLHSALMADCDYFLTSDRRLLNLKFYKKTKIVSKI